MQQVIFQQIFIAEREYDQGVNASRETWASKLRNARIVWSKSK